VARRIRIAPSILAANFACLAEEIKKVEPHVEMLHLDVMDGHFVPNITFGPPLVASVRKMTDLYLDVHLMIDQPEKYIEPFAQAGADNLTFHIEIVREPGKLIERIRGLGKDAGVSLNPDTPVESLEPVVDIVDMVLAMTVPAGFGGQTFREEVLDKVTALRDRRADLAIEVDGGINAHTIPLAVQAGADTIVAGTAVFGADDPGSEVVKLKQLAEKSVGRSGLVL